MTFNNFTIRDNSSEIARILPEKWIEPLAIISIVKGYDSIDDYVLDLIKERLEMFADTRDELGEDFQKYMHNIMIGKDVKNPWARKKYDDTEVEKKQKQEIPN